MVRIAGILVLGAVIAMAAAACAQRPTDLGATLPKTFSGEAITPTTLSGDSALAGSDVFSRTLRDTVARAGKSPSDVSVARAVTSNGDLVFAIRVAGADSSALVSTYETLWGENVPGLRTAALNLGGKETRQLIAPGGVRRVYLYGREDVLYVVASSEDAVAAEALKALP